MILNKYLDWPNPETQFDPLWYLSLSMTIVSDPKRKDLEDTLSLSFPISLFPGWWKTRKCSRINQALRSESSDHVKLEYYVQYYVARQMSNLSLSASRPWQTAQEELFFSFLSPVINPHVEASPEQWAGLYTWWKYAINFYWTYTSQPEPCWDFQFIYKSLSFCNRSLSDRMLGFVWY